MLLSIIKLHLFSFVLYVCLLQLYKQNHVQTKSDYGDLFRHYRPKPTDDLIDWNGGEMTFRLDFFCM